MDTRAAGLRGSREEGKSAAGEAKDLQSWEGWGGDGSAVLGRWRLGGGQRSRFQEERLLTPDGVPKPEVGWSLGLDLSVLPVHVQAFTVK